MSNPPNPDDAFKLTMSDTHDLSAIETSTGRSISSSVAANLFDDTKNESLLPAASATSSDNPSVDNRSDLPRSGAATFTNSSATAASTALSSPSLVGEQLAPVEPINLKAIVEAVETGSIPESVAIEFLFRTAYNDAVNTTDPNILELWGRFSPTLVYPDILASANNPQKLMKIFFRACYWASNGFERKMDAAAMYSGWLYVKASIRPTESTEMYGDALRAEDAAKRALTVHAMATVASRTGASDGKWVGHDHVFQEEMEDTHYWGSDTMGWKWGLMEEEENGGSEELKGLMDEFNKTRMIRRVAGRTEWY